MWRRTFRRAATMAALTLAAGLLANCVPHGADAVDTRPPLPPTHLGKAGAVMLGRTESVGAWEITVLETELDAGSRPAVGDATLSPMERRRALPFVVRLRVERKVGASKRLRDALSFQAYTRQGSRFAESTSIGRCAERTGVTERLNPLVRGGERLVVDTCFFVSLEDWDGLFLAVRDAESGDARGFRLQPTSH